MNKWLIGLALLAGCNGVQPIKQNAIDYGQAAGMSVAGASCIENFSTYECTVFGLPIGQKLVLLCTSIGCKEK
jgi:hypothetical protein